jgi:hypothetical protein
VERVELLHERPLVGQGLRGKRKGSKGVELSQQTGVGGLFLVEPLLQGRRPPSLISGAPLKPHPENGWSGGQASALGGEAR